MNRFQTWLYIYLIQWDVAALKNDDAEDSDLDDEDHDAAAALEAELIRRGKIDESGRRAPAEKQPTGRVVGVIKRNWRA